MGSGFSELVIPGYQLATQLAHGNHAKLVEILLPWSVWYHHVGTTAATTWTAQRVSLA